ncbi:MAG TPA: hypothetical protein VFI22_01260, partial [Thermomicrobiales bacterium]|nr:hypothetical protein [Thermomicrobiales bacterium]
MAASNARATKPKAESSVLSSAAKRRAAARRRAKAQAAAQRRIEARQRRQSRTAAPPNDAAETAKAAGLHYANIDWPGIRRRRVGKGWRYLAPDG